MTGLDFSEPAVDAARALALEAGLDARFVCADVFDATAALGQRYDVVYTGIGALLEQGLALELFHEFDHTAFARWPFMERSADGTYRSPPGTPRLPLLYSLRARQRGSLT